MANPVHDFVAPKFTSLRIFNTAGISAPFSGQLARQVGSNTARKCRRVTRSVAESHEHPLRGEALGPIKAIDASLGPINFYFQQWQNPFRTPPRDVVLLDGATGHLTHVGQWSSPYQPLPRPTASLPTVRISPYTQRRSMIINVYADAHATTAREGRDDNIRPRGACSMGRKVHC